jgi:hypothetical protein
MANVSIRNNRSIRAEAPDDIMLAKKFLMSVGFSNGTSKTLSGRKARPISLPR